MNATTPSEAFAAFAHFRILCALRNGPYGVNELNQLVENVLSLKGIHDPESHKKELLTNNLLSPKPTFYERQAIMVTQNNYEFNLFNGDMGVVFKNEHGQLAGYFETHDKEGARSERSIPVSLIPPCVTAFATTIHKSQGSEFSNLMIVLPPKYTPILSKELLYTAITRVKPDPKNPATTGAIDLWCTEEIFKSAALNATNRTSGLKEALHRLQFQTEIGVSV
jgi:exodeoxyribonuclease V alpha subunit